VTDSLIHHLRTVAVDFDGVIHTYASGWTGYEPTDGPEPGALEFIERLISDGYRVVIMSSRAHTADGRRHIQRWLLRYGFPVLEVTAQKVMAVAYVDDRAVPYETGSGSWPAALDRIEALTVGAAKQDRIQGEPNA
jgi:hypothetical protein